MKIERLQPRRRVSAAAISDTWHHRFLDLAHYIAGWSKDPSTKVGAVIVDPTSKAILSTGFNGLPRGLSDTQERLTDRDYKLTATAHAEVNAIVHAARFGHRIADAVLYTSLPSCAHCASAIIQAGIAQVVTTANPFPERWAASFNAGQDMLLEAGVEVLKIHTDA